MSMEQLCMAVDIPALEVASDSISIDSNSNLVFFLRLTESLFSWELFHVSEVVPIKTFCFFFASLFYFLLV